MSDVMKQRLYYDLTRSKLDEQSRHNSEIETKATGLLGFTTSFMAVAVVVIGLTASPAWWLSLFLIPMAVGVIWVAIKCLAVLKPIEWDGYPNLDNYTAIMGEYESAAMVEAMGDSFLKAYKHNKLLIDEKADWLNSAIYALVGQILVLAVLGCVVAVL